VITGVLAGPKKQDDTSLLDIIDGILRGKGGAIFN
jgi:hypothetical protein